MRQQYRFYKDRGLIAPLGSKCIPPTDWEKAGKPWQAQWIDDMKVLVLSFNCVACSALSPHSIVVLVLPCQADQLTEIRRHRDNDNKRKAAIKTLTSQDFSLLPRNPLATALPAQFPERNYVQGAMMEGTEEEFAQRMQTDHGAILRPCEQFPNLGKELCVTVNVKRDKPLLFVFGEFKAQADPNHDRTIQVSKCMELYKQLVWYSPTKNLTPAQGSV